MAAMQFVGCVAAVCVVAALVCCGSASPLPVQAGKPGMRLSTLDAHQETVSRGPKVHPLSQFRPAIGARANTSGVGTTLVVEPATISGPYVMEKRE